MYSNPVISVIVPAYNEEQCIGRCIEALRAQQTRVPYEIIVVDNNSTDDTGALARRPGVRVCSESRQGRAYARQAGVRAARGEILAFTEADCVVSPTWVEQIYSYFRLHPEVVGVSGSYRYIHSAPYVSPVVSWMLDGTSALYKFCSGNHTFRGTNFAVRKEVLSNAGGFLQQAAPFDDVECGRRVGRYGSIHYLRHLMVYTSDRRIRGRLFKYVWEFVWSYSNIFLFKRHGNDHWYEPIRTI